MKLRLGLSIFILFLLSCLSGCNHIGDKAASASVVYCITAIISFALIFTYFFVTPKKNNWFLLLISSVFVVNIGYFMLSVSDNLEQALMANRISYLGSVFLPFSMLIIILNLTAIKYKKILPILLGLLGIVVFLIAASPGILPIYYKEVTFEVINGASTINKVYGPLHPMYLLYLIGYFAAMNTSIIYAFYKKTIKNISHSIILLVSVFINLSVWFIEQLVKIDFELLSVSYIISEMFLISLNLIITENEKLKSMLEENVKTAHRKGAHEIDTLSKEEMDFYTFAKKSLTQTEKTIFNSYIDGLSTKDIMKNLDITENTLKFHNKNIYGKFCVSSRKELMQFNRRFVFSKKRLTNNK